MKIAREVVRHPSASMRCLLLRQDAFAGEMHRHEHVELTWIERGCGLRWVGDSVEPFGDGDLVLVGAELPHLWVSHGRREKGGCRATVLQFPADWVSCPPWPELAPVETLLRRATSGLVLQGDTRDAVQRCLARLPAAPDALRAALLLEALALMAAPGAMWRALATRPPPGDGAGGAARGRRIDAVLQWIAARLGDELTVADAAAVARVSPAAFGRFFRREVGKGFVEYVNDARCSWAALRLLQEDAPIAEIALGCGFPTLSNFGAQFRRRHGVSPREYRQREPTAARPGGRSSPSSAGRRS